MKNISGIKSVDFKISAEGFGVVNWNGNISVFSEKAGKVVNNHMLPKLRNLDLMRVKKFEDIDDSARLYISQNCIRNALFRDFTTGLKEVSLSNVESVLQSLVGLVRGYVIAEGSTSLKRKSPLFIEDFVAGDDSTLNFETFSQVASRNETSLYSKHTTGAVSYTAFGSINIEDLQFLSLEDSLNRSCYREVITEAEGRALAEKITDYLKSLDFDGQKNPEAIFANNYVRINSISKAGEAGILLNDDAISLVVEETLSLIRNLYISRSKAYVEMKEFLVDYNDDKAMRIKSSVEDIDSEKHTNYAVYYEAQLFTAEEYERKLEEQAKAKQEADSKKKKKGA
ncbi:type I-Fv CRISPR-associated protein Cas7fv [Citrobacter koseri]|uniref:type I-Fv CRISPR-associated protein Cas7fv n=1 Tax=Citrobacter koseri TaxID=545 RepID=UPI00389213AD